MSRINVQIRTTLKEDHEHIWQLFKAVIDTGDAFMQDKTFIQHEWQQLWLAKDVKSFTAIINNVVVGAYILKPNQLGYGNHVANGCYVVDSNYRGKGIGDQLAQHSIQQASNEGYLSMQFNAVIATNTVAVKLWEKHGFKIIATLPKAFRHHQFGLVDVFVMHLTIVS